MADLVVNCIAAPPAPPEMVMGMPWQDAYGDLPTWIAALFSILIAGLIWWRNRRDVHDMAMQAVSNQWQQFNLAAVMDPRLTALLAAEEELTPERTQALYLVFFHLTSAHQIWLSQRNDGLDRRFGGVLSADLLKALHHYPDEVKIALDGRGYDPRFVTKVKEILRKTKPPKREVQLQLKDSPTPDQQPSAAAARSKTRPKAKPRGGKRAKKPSPAREGDAT